MSSHSFYRDLIPILKEPLAIIALKGVRYSYPGARGEILSEINLAISKGEFVLLTGPSGCGKTTLCRCFNGLIPHFYNGSLIGEVEVAGFNVKETPTSKLAQHVGLVFQNPDNQIFALTVEKDVAFGLENLGFSRGEMIERIDWALDVTGISSLRNRAPHELSGGQKQRLAIASILAMKPEIVVLDEPTSFLDPVGAEKILQILHWLNKELSITVILIEHRLDLVAPYLDRVVVMHQGRIIADGLPEQVLMDEEKLVGVGVPKISLLLRRLKDAGIDLGAKVLTPVDLAETLRKRLEGLSNRIPAEGSIRGKPATDESTTNRTAESDPIVQAKGLRFSYRGSVNALDDVSVEIRQGEFLAIMGENGAGKTTLVKHFNGLLRPSKGEVYIAGKNIRGMSVASIARTVGLVFQNPDDQIFSESVEAEIAFALRNFGFDESSIEEKVSWTLNLLDIAKYRRDNPFTLSGGERKRVALASILAWNPDVLILDEPTIGQEYAQKKRLKDLLLQLRDQGKTVVMVTHDVEFVAECKPRVVLMAKGKIIADGPAGSLLTNVESLKQASVSPPEIAKAFLKLAELGFPYKAINVDEAYELICCQLKVSTQ